MQFVFAATLFTSALLLFVVQPMFAKMVLPLLGGTPAVWNTCMVFYQTALLVGYIYAHLSTKWLGTRRQAVLHLVLLCLPWIVLPIGVTEGWTPPADANPIPWLLMLLSLSVGLPFLVISASAPMLQAWFADTDHPAARDPYFLYSASNLGSMIALLGYPLLLEPRLTLCQQAQSWAAGYGVFMLLTLGCAWLLWRSRPGDIVCGLPEAESSSETMIAAPSWLDRLRWLALSLVPSSLLLGVTTYISTDIAAVPLMWVIPLTLYLLTFVLVFARWTLLPHRLMVVLQPPLIMLVAASTFVTGLHATQIEVLFPLHLLLFFVTAMVCHGELAARRPAPGYLTEFYLWMSLGGVLGGLFNAMVAPLVFSSVLEYPLMIAAACLVRPVPRSARRPRLAMVLDVVLPLAIMGVFGGLAACVAASESARPLWLSAVMSRYFELAKDHPQLARFVFLGVVGLLVLTLQNRPVRFALGIAALMLVSILYTGRDAKPLFAARSFFGVLRVEDDADDEAHRLMHGSTTHGMQSLDPELAGEPWTYYHRRGPVGMLFAAFSQRRPITDIGVIGLGTGSMAAYGEPNQHITFFEIDPTVERIARDPELFTYLTNCRASFEVVLGDARLSLTHGRPRQFDVLLVDAFSSDAIPLHLLTREALQLYLRNLAEDGVLAIHISNRYLELSPVVGNLAEDAGVVARICSDDGEDPLDEDTKGKFASEWVVLARQPEHLGELDSDPLWEVLDGDQDQPLWTDDYSNIIGVLDWNFNWRQLQVWASDE